MLVAIKAFYDQMQVSNVHQDRVVTMEPRDRMQSMSSRTGTEMETVVQAELDRLLDGGV